MKSACVLSAVVTVMGLAAPWSMGADRERSATVNLSSHVIDLDANLPLVPDEMEASLLGQGEEYLLVKYPAPVTSEQLLQLESSVERIYAYLPHDAFLVRARSADVEKLGARWVGPYHPYYKISKSVAAATAARSQGSISMMVHVYPDADLDQVLERLEGLGVKGVVGLSRGGLFGRIRVLLGAAEIEKVRDDIARIPEVFWIDVEARRVLLNDTTIWVGQSGLSGGQQTPIFDQGIYGEGQIVGVLDTGIDPDMCYFRDPVHGLPPINACNGGTTVDLDQRKVIAVDFLWQSECNGGISGSEWDTHDHGTHVAGTVAGDDLASPLLHDPGDGMAPGARLVVQDCGYQTDDCADCPGIGCPVVDLNPVFQQPYDQGARIHTNSWGDRENASVQNTYSAGSQDADEFMWNHKDFLLMFAAGNSGPGDETVGSPSTAKNVISVGATNRGTSAESMALFSSCGPTDDGRIKPDFTAPGVNIVSANNDGTIVSDNCGTRTMSGTSMASPAAAGLAALVRQYYTDGFYPTGSAQVADEMVPSAALVKATLLNSAQQMTGVSQPIPSSCQGWGRILLDNALYFNGEERTLFAVDESAGFDPGSHDEVYSYPVTVTASSAPFKATLVWTDYPSTPAANPHLNDDLDLEVVGPGGTYLGNVFANGQSVVGGNADRLNTVEQVLIFSPPVGSYTVNVRSFNVPNGPQPFALAVTGALSTCEAPDPPATVDAEPAGEGEISVTWSSVSGVTSYRVLRADDTGCPAAGFSEVAVVTAPTTQHVDSGLAGGVSYAYQVVAVGDCNSEPSACVSATATGPCTTPPTFDGASSAAVIAGSCSIRLEWDEAIPLCSTGVSYNVYRSTSAGFTPSSSNRIATCVSSLSHDDTDLPADTYYYKVRAEDGASGGGGPCNNGNEDANTVEVSASTGASVVDLLDEDFESAAEWATNWTVTTGPGPHTCGPWARVSTSKQRPTGGSGTYALTDSDACGSGSQTSTILTSRTMDAGGATSLTIDLDMYYNHYNGDDATIEVWNGTSWVVIWADSNVDVNAHRSFDVTAHANPGFRVRFSYQNASYDYWFAVDNVVVTAEVNQSCP